MERISMNSQLETNEDSSGLDGNGKDLHITVRNALENRNEIDINGDDVRDHRELLRAKLHSVQCIGKEKKENERQSSGYSVFATTLNIIYFSIYIVLVGAICVFVAAVGITAYGIADIAGGSDSDSRYTLCFGARSKGIIIPAFGISPGNIVVAGIFAAGALLVGMPFINAPPPVADPPPPPPDLLDDTNPGNSLHFNHPAIHENIESGQSVVQQVLQDPLPHQHPAPPPPDLLD